jgi:uncharacterized phage protein (TIGR01671 family)
MKREIKFRGKDKKTGEWFYGNLFDKDTSGRTHICTTKKGCLDIDPNTVGQFTGLKDKNGKEIYEGDIVDVAVSPINYVGKDPTPYHRICVCVYQKENASFIYERVGKNYKRKLSRNWKYKVMGSYDIQCVEIIGNIYDNPELLTEK